MDDRFKLRFWNKGNKQIETYSYDNLGFILSNPQALIRYIPMQCIGLKDRNGKLIYEGDCIKNLKTNTIYEVFWEQQATCFMLKSTRFGGVISTYMMFDEYPNDLEVIGNIYENKELLNE